MVVSQNREPQYRPQNITVLIIGTPEMVPLISGNPHIKEALWGLLRESLMIGLPLRAPADTLSGGWYDGRRGVMTGSI